MLTEQLEEVDELLSLIMQAHARLNSIETALVMCSFGAWQGAAAQNAHESRLHIAARMDHAQEYLNAAQAYLDHYRTMLHAHALTMP